MRRELDLYYCMMNYEKGIRFVLLYDDLWEGHL